MDYPFVFLCCCVPLVDYNNGTRKIYGLLVYLWNFEI